MWEGPLGPDNERRASRGAKAPPTFVVGTARCAVRENHRTWSLQPRTPQRGVPTGFMPASQTGTLGVKEFA
jgi:hypothetical protein